MALIVRTDGSTQLLEGTKPGKLLDWQQIKKAIGGGYVEAVACDPAVTGGYDHFYCDEEGKLKGFKPNMTAYKMSTLTADSDMIVGNVVFCKSVPTDDGTESK